MYVFKLGDEILGVCDEDNLKEYANKMYVYAFNQQEANDLFVCYFEPNVFDFKYPTYQFDEYYDGEDKYLGLRLYGLAGDVDIPLGIKLIEVN